MESTLRIIQVINVRWFNATAWYGLFLSRLLRDAGHDVRVLALPGTEPFARAEAMGFEPVALNLNAAGPLALSGAVRAMSQLLRAFQPHIVNCHRGEGMILWGLLKAMGHSFALVRTRGDQRLPRNNWPNRYLHTRLTDAVIVTNSRMLRHCRDLLSVPEERLHLIVGGTDHAVFAPNAKDRASLRAALGFDDKTIVLGLLGRFDAVKGQRELLQAFSMLRKGDGPQRFAHPERMRLLLAGFPTSAVSGERVEAWIARYGLADCTTITGKVERPSAYINAMDVGVIASQGSEAIARAAFEIMACGLPLVGTSVGVMPDLLPEEALTPPGDAHSLAVLLARAANDASFRDALRAYTRKRLPEFSEHAFLTQTLRVYTEALRRGAGTEA